MFEMFSGSLTSFIKFDRLNKSFPSLNLKFCELLTKMYSCIKIVFSMYNTRLRKYVVRRSNSFEVEHHQIVKTGI